MVGSQNIQKQIIYDMLSVVEDTQRNLNNIKLESNVTLSYSEDIIQHNIEMLNVYAHEFARLQMIEQKIEPSSFSWKIKLSELSDALLKQVSEGYQDVVTLLFPQKEIAMV